MTLPRKLPGHCTLCGVETHEIRAVAMFPEQIKGWPRRVGRPQPNARRVTYLLSDGSQADVTLCGVCTDNCTDPDFARQVWERVKECQVWEHRNRMALGARPPTHEQAETLEKNLRAFLDVVPLSVVAIRRLVEDA